MLKKGVKNANFKATEKKLSAIKGNKLMIYHPFFIKIIQK